jgi:hypothetical protein
MASKSAHKLWRTWILGTIMVKLQIGETATGVDPDVATKVPAQFSESRRMPLIATQVRIQGYGLSVALSNLSSYTCKRRLISSLL